MWDRRTVLAAPLLLLLVLRTVIARSDNVSGDSALAWTWFPHLTSKDTDMDPSKAVRSDSWDAHLAVPNYPRYVRLETNLGIRQAKEGSNIAEIGL
ncbi:hypothetical protein TNCV_1850242 [Trichonephila clavipes]|nr:hypothetical protein TNCV_1850242 [Trichonephila clavipes]